MYNLNELAFEAVLEMHLLCNSGKCVGIFE